MHSGLEVKGLMFSSEPELCLGTRNNPLNIRGMIRFRIRIQYTISAAGVCMQSLTDWLVLTYYLAVSTKMFTYTTLRRLTR